PRGRPAVDGAAGAGGGPHGGRCRAGRDRRRGRRARRHPDRSAAVRGHRHARRPRRPVQRDPPPRHPRDPARGRPGDVVAGPGREAMTVAVQALGRIQWGNLTFGPGTPYTVTAVEGLDDLPSIRSEDVDRPGEHGEYTGPDFTGARVVQVKLGLRGQSPNDLRALSIALQAATQPQRQPAPLAFLDQDRLLMAKVRKRNIPYDAEYLWRLGDAALEFYCADPYLYGLEQKTVSTTAYSPSAGRTYPLVYSGTGEPATNLVLNPSAEVDLTNTVSLGANISRVRTTAEARYGTASVECTHTSGTASQAGNLW